MEKSLHFNEVTRRAFETAMSILKARFEDVPEVDRLAYHSSAHTKGVLARAQKIGRRIGLSEHKRVLVSVAALFHDTVQTFEVQTNEDGHQKRVRFGGMNELMSAMDAVSFMQGDPYSFDSIDEALVGHAIISTTPKWSHEHKTVIQPLVNEQSHIVTRVLALADLGEAGMDSEAFLSSGYSLFAEDNVDVVAGIMSAQVPGDISLEVRKSYRNRLLWWLSKQPDFARGREELLTEELIGFGVPRWKIRRELFNQFGASIEGAQKVLEDARSLDFVPLMRRLHPDAFPGMEK